MEGNEDTVGATEFKKQARSVLEIFLKKQLEKRRASLIIDLQAPSFGLLSVDGYTNTKKTVTSSTTSATATTFTPESVSPNRAVSSQVSVGPRSSTTSQESETGEENTTKRTSDSDAGRRTVTVRKKKSFFKRLQENLKRVPTHAKVAGVPLRPARSDDDIRRVGEETLSSSRGDDDAERRKSDSLLKRLTLVRQRTSEDLLDTGRGSQTASQRKKRKAKKELDRLREAAAKRSEAGQPVKSQKKKSSIFDALTKRKKKPKDTSKEDEASHRDEQKDSAVHPISVPLARKPKPFGSPFFAGLLQGRLSLASHSRSGQPESPQTAHLQKYPTPVREMGRIAHDDNVYRVKGLNGIDVTRTTTRVIHRVSGDFAEQSKSVIAANGEVIAAPRDVDESSKKPVAAQTAVSGASPASSPVDTEVNGDRDRLRAPLASLDDTFLLDDDEGERGAAARALDAQFTAIADRLAVIGDSCLRAQLSARRSYVDEIELQTTLTEQSERRDGDGATPSVQRLASWELEIVQWVRSRGDRIQEEMPPSVLQQLAETRSNEAFRGLMTQLTTGSPVVGQLAMVFYLTSSAIKVAGGAGSSAARSLKEFCVSYVVDKFHAWIVDQGGWVSAVESASDGEVD